MMNSEAHRQFYLSVAGIRMWYAKRPLPGAAPSMDYEPADIEQTDEPMVEGYVGITRQPDRVIENSEAPSRPRSVNLQALMVPAAEEPETPEVPKTLKHSQAEAVRPQRPEAENNVSSLGTDVAVSAHLGFWSTKSYLLISQWSDEASERLQDSLAKNVLHALGERGEGERRMLQWPVFRNPYIPGNSTEDFQAVLSRLVSASPGQSIILLGVMNDVQGEVRQQCIRPLLARVAVDFPYSIAELSATPSRKRDLWKALVDCFLS